MGLSQLVRQVFYEKRMYCQEVAQTKRRRWIIVAKKKDNKKGRQRQNEETAPGYGNKKIEGPNRPST
ncbi:hypothetical protein [Fredinandcohnia quinoae]|uniref:hypothetical protein n=1 Tax=Fredinandcohnia quinoae TaxID=2918902 RepID=UPI001F0623C4|nr:hypothetical protein [Fredinandcohnia sp. SECRCQ15]